MRYVLDKKHLGLYKLSIEDGITLLSIAEPSSEEQLERLVKMNLIKWSESTKSYILVNRAALIKIVKERDIETTQLERVEKLTITLQNIFPEGRKIGTSFYWRCNSKEVVKKLFTLLNMYPDLTDTQIINATKKYVNDFKEDKTYMQLLKYFILKNDTSSLLTYIENEDSIDEQSTTDWTSQII